MRFHFFIVLRIISAVHVFSASTTDHVSSSSHTAICPETVVALRKQIAHLHGHDHATRVLLWQQILSVENAMFAVDRAELEIRVQHAEAKLRDKRQQLEQCLANIEDVDTPEQLGDNLDGPLDANQMKEELRQAYAPVLEKLSDNVDLAEEILEQQRRGFDAVQAEVAEELRKTARPLALLRREPRDRFPPGGVVAEENHDCSALSDFHARHSLLLASAAATSLCVAALVSEHSFSAMHRASHGLADAGEVVTHGLADVLLPPEYGNTRLALKLGATGVSGATRLGASAAHGGVCSLSRVAVLASPLAGWAVSKCVGWGCWALDGAVSRVRGYYGAGAICPPCSAETRLALADGSSDDRVLLDGRGEVLEGNQEVGLALVKGREQEGGGGD